VSDLSGDPIGLTRDRLVGAWHATDLRPVLGAGAASGLLVAITGWQAGGEPQRLATVAVPCAGLLAVALATAVDERPAGVLAASPTTLRRRLLSRLVVVAALVALVTTILAVALLAFAEGQGPWPWRRMALELAALGLVSVGLAAQGRRWFPDVPGGLTAAGVLGVAWLGWLLIPTPSGWVEALDALPDLTLVGGAVVLGGGLLWRATTDPARPQGRLRASTR